MVILQINRPLNFFLGNENVVRILLEKQTNVNAKLSNGDTPLHVAAFNGEFQND